MRNRNVIYDITGKTFNNIQVLERDKSNTKHGTYYFCKCLLCGNVFSKDSYSIRHDTNYSCGCIKYSLDLTGKKFNHLKVIKFIKVTNHNEKLWECKCDCGNVCYHTSNQLTKGYSKQCKKCGYKITAIKNAKPKKFSKKLVECYVNMKTRTTNKKQDKYNRYINRNITMCDEWLNDYYAFEKWALENGYQENLTIDRIDNNKGYSPDNCRWVDRIVQANNRRTNVCLEYNGKIKTMAQWSRELNIPYWKMQRYNQKKYSVEKMIYEHNNHSRYKGKDRCSR